VFVIVYQGCKSLSDISKSYTVQLKSNFHFVPSNLNLKFLVQVSGGKAKNNPIFSQFKFLYLNIAKGSFIVFDAVLGRVYNLV
jgi:hypothetical protein